MGQKILAIDDNIEFLGTLKDILEDKGYDVTTLADSMKAEHYIDKYTPDLLIIDVFMPERSGFNLVEDFNERGLYGSIPKIFLTCLDDDVERMTARACGVAQYLTKPFQPEDLLDLVESTLALDRKQEA